MTLNNRREFLKKTLQLILGFVYALTSNQIFSANRFSVALGKNSFNETLNLLFDAKVLTTTTEIIVTLPEIAENGAVVPMTINSALENIQRIYILVEKNPTPLVAVVDISPQVMVFFSTRIKMAESSLVYIIAQREDKLLCTQQWVKVVTGGCGTG